MNKIIWQDKTPTEKLMLMALFMNRRYYGRNMKMYTSDVGTIIGSVNYGNIRKVLHRLTGGGFVNSYRIGRRSLAWTISDNWYQDMNEIFKGTVLGEE